MRRWLHALPACLAAACVLSVGTAAQQPVAGQPQLKAGDQAPGFTLQASDGRTYSLSQLRGKTVVLGWFPKAFTGG